MLMQYNEQNQLAVATGVSGTAVLTPPKRVKKKVLAEETYLAAMDEIIQRDFFPNITIQELQLQYLEAKEKNDLGAMQVIKNQFEKLTKQPTQEKTGELHISLDQFHAQHASEDNDSFAELVEDETKRLEEKNQRIFNRNPQQAQLLLTDGSTSRQTAQPLLGWNYNVRNALMYTPEALPADPPQFIGAPKEIVKSNTRFPEPIPTSLDVLPEQETLIFQRPSAPLQFGRNGIDSSKKIDLESLYDHTVAAQAKHYDLVPSPVITPGSVGDGDGIPFVTWGAIQATPVVVSRATQGGYKMPDTPVREKVAMELKEKASQQQREKKTQIQTGLFGVTV